MQQLKDWTPILNELEHCLESYIKKHSLVCFRRHFIDYSTKAGNIPIRKG